MWTTVLVLAIATNFEPTRIGLVPLLLSRERPLLQLLVFLVGNFTVSFGFGFLTLFVFRQNPVGSSNSSGGKAQIAIGALALVVALILAMRAARNRSTARLDGGSAAEQPAAQPRAVGKFTDRVRKVLRKGRSPWLAGLVGMGTGLPSVDYLATLIVIGTSGKSPAEQGAALVTSGVVGSLVLIAPLVGYLIAPESTRQRINRFGAWTRSRSQMEYAGLLALIGCLFIGLGIARL